jgi:hypothetical protein
MTTQDPSSGPPTGPSGPPPSKDAPPPVRTTYGTASVPPPAVPQSRSAEPGRPGGAVPPPAVPPPSTKSDQAPPGSRRGTIAVGVALLALIVSLASAVFAWRAIDQANDARDMALAGGGRSSPGTDPAGGGVTTAPTTDAGPAATTKAPAADPNATPAAPVLNEQTKYRVKYTKRAMNLQTRCGSDLYIDLDEPRVRVDASVAELSFSMPCGTDPAYFKLTGAEGSAVESPKITPSDCNDKIQLSPVGDDVQLPARQGRVLCVKTSLGRADAAGDTWKMVVVEVTATGEDGVVSIEASAWDIPT